MPDDRGALIWVYMILMPRYDSTGNRSCAESLDEDSAMAAATTIAKLLGIKPGDPAPIGEPDD